MVFSVPEVVAYVSQLMSLQSDDVVPTGTLPGVGGGMTPPEFLQAGQVVTLGIDGLGEQRHTIVAID